MDPYSMARHISRESPELFWAEAAKLIDWQEFPSTILDRSTAPLYRWFPDGRLNTCYNAVDRHVANGHGGRPAIFYDSAVTGRKRTISYEELLTDVALFAGVLAEYGVATGDRVIVYMPMIPQAIVAMLACARLGAVHSVVFGGFSSAELASRIDDARPKLIVTASCGVEPGRIVEYKPLIDSAISLASHKPDRTIVWQRPELRAEMLPRDIDWVKAMSVALAHPVVPVAATDPLYVLYTSGTTGRPKGIVRDNGGHAVAMAWSLRNVYGITSRDVFWAASDIGWVVGHSYIVYAPLICGAATVLYEGKPVGTPDAGSFWRVIEDYKVNALFTSPTALRVIKRADSEGRLLKDYDISSMRALFLAGERLDPDTYHWATGHLHVPVIDNWWQTETGWPISSNLRGLHPMPIKAGSPSVPVPGFDVRIVDDGGLELPPNTEGSIVIKLPMPPGTLPTLWHDDARYVEEYLSAVPGFYTTGDGGYVDEDGYLFVMGRTDDVINVAGHRLSTGAMEAIVSSHPAVAECAVLGVQDELRGQVPRALVVLKLGAEVDDDTLANEIIAAVRAGIGPVASLKSVAVVPALPKTRSGKILRRAMRAIADGRDEPVPATIEDASVLENLRPFLIGS